MNKIYIFLLKYLLITLILSSPVFSDTISARIIPGSIELFDGTDTLPANLTTEFTPGETMTLSFRYIVQDSSFNDTYHSYLSKINFQILHSSENDSLNINSKTNFLISGEVNNSSGTWVVDSTINTSSFKVVKSLCNLTSDTDIQIGNAHAKITFIPGLLTKYSPNTTLDSYIILIHAQTRDSGSVTGSTIIFDTSGFSCKFYSNLQIINDTSTPFIFDTGQANPDNKDIRLIHPSTGRIGFHIISNNDFWIETRMDSFVSNIDGINYYVDPSVFNGDGNGFLSASSFSADTNNSLNNIKITYDTVSFASNYFCMKDNLVNLGDTD